MIVRERGGNSVPAVFKIEAQAASFHPRRASPRAPIVNADEAASWDDLHARFEMKRINHRGSLSASTALARIGPRNFSAACAAPKSATITISLAHICSATRRKRHGARITAAMSNGEQVEPPRRAGDEAEAVSRFQRLLAAAHSGIETTAPCAVRGLTRAVVHGGIDGSGAAAPPVISNISQIRQCPDRRRLPLPVLTSRPVFQRVRSIWMSCNPMPFARTLSAVSRPLARMTSKANSRVVRVPCLARAAWQMTHGSPCGIAGACPHSAPCPWGRRWPRISGSRLQRAPGRRGPALAVARRAGSRRRFHRASCGEL